MAMLPSRPRTPAVRHRLARRGRSRTRTFDQSRRSVGDLADVVGVDLVMREDLVFDLPSSWPLADAHCRWLPDGSDGPPDDFVLALQLYGGGNETAGVVAGQYVQSGCPVRGFQTSNTSASGFSAQCSGLTLGVVVGSCLVEIIGSPSVGQPQVEALLDLLLRDLRTSACETS